MTSESKSWPLLDERAPFATTSLGRAGRRLPRSAWPLTGLAFLCGRLLSASTGPTAVRRRHARQLGRVFRVVLPQPPTCTDCPEARLFRFTAAEEGEDLEKPSGQ